VDLLFTNLRVHGFIEDVVVVEMASAFMITFLHALRAKDRSTSSSPGVLSSGNFFKISGSSMKVSSPPRLMAVSFCVGRKASTRITHSAVDWVPSFRGPKNDSSRTSAMHSGLMDRIA
jgi:hypothetical protein